MRRPAFAPQVQMAPFVRTGSGRGAGTRIAMIVPLTIGIRVLSLLPTYFTPLACGLLESRLCERMRAAASLDKA